jgi:iron complex outermembrane receptor protein
MNLNRNPLSGSIRYGLAIGAVGLTSIAATPAIAFAQDADGTKTLDRIEITGSRIKRVDVETSQPIFVITRSDIEKQGYVTVDDILRKLPMTSTSGTNRSTVLNSATTAGGTFINMRNLGSNRALVLVDGRRWGTNHQGSTDLNTIPSSIIERIEILKDGASAIYGTDAIAGVINIITRSQFDGAEVRAYFGQNSKGDGKSQQYDMTLGTTGERSALVFSATYEQLDPVWAKDRDLTLEGYGPYHIGAGYSATPNRGVATVPGRGQLTVREGGNSRNAADYVPYTSDMYYNANQQMMYTSGHERKSIFTKGHFDLTDDIRFRADAMYNETEAHVQYAGFPLSSTTSNTPDRLRRSIPLSASSYYNPFGQNVSWLRRIVEQPRTQDNTNRTYRFGAGFEGAFDFVDRSFAWDVNYFYNKNSGTQIGKGDINLLRLESALGPSFLDAAGVVRCGQPGAVIAGCVPVDILSYEGGITPDMLNYIGVTTQRTYGSETTGYSANISGDIAPLPGGNLAFAAGYEYRRDTGYEQPDQFASSGYFSGNASGPTQGSFSVNEFYLELNAPLLKDVTGFKELELNVAARASDYSNFGNTVNEKYGFRWKPIDDLMVRGSYGTGFRAPTISNLYALGSQAFDTYQDPCNSRRAGGQAATCAAAGVPANFVPRNAAGAAFTTLSFQTPFPFNSGGNPELLPEKSKTTTLGLVYSPSYVSGLNISLDWWKIRIKDLIVSNSATYILNECYLNEGTNWCSAFTRDLDPSSTYYGQVVTLNRSLSNRGWVETQGFDFGATYRLNDLPFGSLGFSIEATYTSKYESQSQPGAAIVQDVGWNEFNRIKGNFGVDWSYGDFGVNWVVRYFSGTKESCVFSDICSNPDFRSPYTGINPVNETGSVSFNDVQVRWNAPWNATIAIGANNVFDRKAPYMYTMNGNYSSTASYNPDYDVDRFVYFRYTQRF